MNNPSKIPGLNIWLDAADTSTINNGQVVDNGNVFSFRDKISNIELTNSQGVNGPSYSIGAVNGRNAISIPYYTDATDVGLKSLSAINVNVLQGFTFSMFCVYKPTTTTQVNDNGNQKYVVTIYSNTRWTGLTSPGGFANRAIYTGDEGGVPNATRRLNPSGRYIEADSNVALGSGWLTYVTYGEHVPSRALNGPTPTSLNKTCLTQVRIQSGLKKMAFSFSGYDFIDDFQSSRIYNTGGSAGINRGLVNAGPVRDVGPNATLIIGSPWPSTPHSPSIRGKTEKLFPLEGFFCEFLYYNRYLSDSESNSVEAYLKEKWMI